MGGDSPTSKDFSMLVVSSRSVWMSKLTPKFYYQDISTESQEGYDPNPYLEETDENIKRITRSMAKGKEKAEEQSVFGMVSGSLSGMVKKMLGQEQKIEEEKNEPGPENNLTEAEETAEAIFESIRDFRKPDEITVR